MLKIITDENPLLRNKSELIKIPLSLEIKNLLLDMRDYLKNSQDDDYASIHHITPGVGLACPQLGLNIQAFVIYYEDDDGIHEHLFVNPRIIRESLALIYLSGGEGCLSVKENHSGYIMRHKKITIKAYDVLEESEVTYVATDYEAIIMQHEYDHLKGVLYYDHINKEDPTFVPQFAKPIN